MLYKFYLLLFFISILTACENTNPANNQKKENTSEISEEKATKTDKVKKVKKTILFFGNSLTAGFGLEIAQAFPALIQNKLDSLNLDYEVVNAGLSGETSAGGNNRIDWLLKQEVHILVLELGGNDGLRGINTIETEKNLQSIIDKTTKKYPDVKIIIAGMEVPPNMGEKYAGEFRQVFKQLAEKNKAILIPFLLDKVGGEPSLNLPDGIHPTVQGHRIVAETVWKTLENVL